MFVCLFGVGEGEMVEGITRWESNPHQQGESSGSQPTEILKFP